MNILDHSPLNTLLTPALSRRVWGKTFGTLAIALSLFTLPCSPVQAEEANPDYEAGAVVLKSGSGEKVKPGTKHHSVTRGELP